MEKSFVRNDGRIMVRNCIGSIGTSWLHGLEIEMELASDPAIIESVLSVCPSLAADGDVGRLVGPLGQLPLVRVAHLPQPRRLKRLAWARRRDWKVQQGSFVG